MCAPTLALSKLVSSFDIIEPRIPIYGCFRIEVYDEGDVFIAIPWAQLREVAGTMEATFGRGTNVVEAVQDLLRWYYAVAPGAGWDKLIWESYASRLWNDLGIHDV
jgi:hypothetical protein